MMPATATALLAVREELEIPLDSETYIRHSDETMKRLKDTT